MFEFQNPLAFLLLLLVPLFYLLRKLKIFKQVTFLAVLADWNGSAFNPKGYFRKIMDVVSKIFLLAGFFCTLISYADPVINSQEKIYTSLGSDVFFVLDTSPSMAARDMEGATRLDAGKTVISNLINKNDGLRYGLVALGDGASVLVPPTNDIDVLKHRLETVSVGMLGNGSAIGDGISTAVCHLASSSAPKKLIILFTDGENNAGEVHPETAAQLACDNNISVYVIGIGSKGTVPISYVDPVSKKDYSGWLDSDYNTNGLKTIASIGNGKFYEAKTMEEFYSLLSVIAKQESVTQSYTYKNTVKYLYKTFLLAALFAFFMAAFIRVVFLKIISQFKIRKILIVRTIFLLFAYVMLILAYMGLSWGTYLYPVQKSGNAVCFVFDISNSMLAKDGPNGITRLDAAKNYAERLLQKMPDTPVSVVLLKGEGVSLIPVTQDFAMIQSLLEVLNPKMMTAAGTSLGKGILCAKETFPKNYSNACKIWLFTDGEETDNLFAPSLIECIKNGIEVSVIGFGTEGGIEVLAGDGKTKVYSCLQNKFIKQTILETADLYPFYNKKFPVHYYDSTENGSGIKLLNQLNSSNSGNQIITYETKNILRYKFFITIALILFCLGIFCVEFNYKRFFSNHNNLKSIFVFTMIFVSSGCKLTSIQTIRGSYNWQQKNYKKSITYFLNSLKNAQEHNNQLAIDYSLYNLGTSYLMLDEDSAAMEKYAKISQNAPKNVLYASYYNTGVIAYKNENYTQAQDFFRKALEVDNTKIDAKINLELSIKMVKVNASQSNTQLNPISDIQNNLLDMENSLFEHIKENDKKQWKNSDDVSTQNLAEDY